MLRSLNTTLGYGIQARDGLIGKVQDYLFEDDTWDIRYLVDDTGEWIHGRKVLIPTNAVGGPDWRNEIFVVPHTCEEIKNGPSLETQAPITREMEMEMFTHYGWVPYWNTYGMAPPIAAPPRLKDSDPHPRAVTNHPSARENTSDDSQFLSLDEVMGFHIENNGDDLGRVADLIFDDEHWQVTGIVFHTGGMLRSKPIQVEVDRVKGVVPEGRKITVTMNLEETENCPSFNPTKLIQDQLHPESDTRSLNPGSV